MKKTYGFTLIELMVAIAVLAIVIAIAAPSYTQFVKKYRLSTQANSFIIAVNLARSEAIKSKFNVILCRSANGTSCANAGGWEQGWVVYVDEDSSATLNTGDRVLKVFQRLTSGNTLRANNNFVNRITYTPRGMTTASGSLVLCDDRTGDKDTNDARDFSFGRGIIISPTGRPRLVATDDPSFSINNCTPS